MKLEQQPRTRSILLHCPAHCPQPPDPGHRIPPTVPCSSRNRQVASPAHLGVNGSFVLKVQQVKVDVNGEWEKVDDEPMEFPFDETTFLATTKNKNDAICELKSNKFSSAVQKRKREESEEECNQEKRRCVEQENGTTENVDQLPSNPVDNDVGRPDEGVNSTSGFNSMHQDQLSVINPNNVTRPNYQQQHTSGSTQPSTSTAHRQDNSFASHNANYQNNNTGFYSSTSVPPTQQYPQHSFHFANANQLNYQNYQPGSYHPNGFSTAHHQNSHWSTSFPTTPAQQTSQHPSNSTNDSRLYQQDYITGSNYQNAVPTLQHQLNASAPSQPTVINQNNFPNYTSGSSYPNASPYLPTQNNAPTTTQHFDNAIPAMYNPTPTPNNLPYHPSQVNYQDLSWQQQQQRPHNFDHQLQWPPHY